MGRITVTVRVRVTVGARVKVRARRESLKCPIRGSNLVTVFVSLRRYRQTGYDYGWGYG